MKSLLRSLVAYLEEINKPSVKTCMAHKERISKMLVAAYAKVRLRIHLRQIPSTHLSGHGSEQGSALRNKLECEVERILAQSEVCICVHMPSQKFYHSWSFI